MRFSNRSLNNFHAAGTNGCLDFSLFRCTSGDTASWPCKIRSVSREPRLANRESLPSGKAQQAACLKGLASGPLE